MTVVDRIVGIVRLRFSWHYAWQNVFFTRFKTAELTFPTVLAAVVTEQDRLDESRSTQSNEIRSMQTAQF